MIKKQISFFWHRRDLRVTDNVGLFNALKSNVPIIPLFIFDLQILKKLEHDDARVSFIHDTLHQLDLQYKAAGSSLLIKYGEVQSVWQELEEEYEIKEIFCNHDYEPFAIQRDQSVQNFCSSKGIGFHSYKDQVIFEKNDILKDDKTPYTIYTPYSKKWMSNLSNSGLTHSLSETLLYNLEKFDSRLKPLEAIGFKKRTITVPSQILDTKIIQQYHLKRDFPALNGTSKLSIHLRFGTISIRNLVSYAMNHNLTYLNELIWREFYMMILYHYPHVVTKSFKPKYDLINWENNLNIFNLWCEGNTGIPLVDAGMRELNNTGYMHNRVRMVTASFLTKNLLIDWRWGETYFASKLLDYDLSANNGGWQWASGSGCDAAPYFRIFNPILQQNKFDPESQYIKKWITEYGTPKYPKPIIDLSISRDRTLKAYKKALD